MKPIGKNIIITPVEEEIKTNSGLLLSAEDMNQLRYKKALVIMDRIFGSLKYIVDFNSLFVSIILS